MIDFSKTFLLLQQEAFLIQSSLLSGLHHLRNARLDTKGQFYAAFFQLSIGLERLMKLTFIINFMREHKMAVPTRRRLKDFGHGLVSLFDHLAALALPGKANPLETIEPNSVERAILMHLSEFAEGARYHNLDTLVRNQQFVDPLEKWDGIIERVLNEDVRDRVKRRIEKQSTMLAKASARISMVVGADLKRRPLDHLSMFSQPQYHDIAAGHLVNHTITLIRVLVQQLDDVCHLILIDPAHDRSQSLPIPHMHEFFNFIHFEKSEILRKRRWP
jgi:hypothetical protein